MEFRACWDKYGKKAGPLRNIAMLDYGRPDEVWAFHDDLANSKGTGHMVKIAEEAGVTVRRFSHEEASP